MVLLYDTVTYKIIHKNPISSVEKELNSFIWNLSKEKINFSIKKKNFSLQISA